MTISPPIASIVTLDSADIDKVAFRNWGLQLESALASGTGPGYFATSTTSSSIATGSKSFATQAGLAYSAGARVRLSSAANTNNYMEGVVASYVGTTLSVTVDAIGGSGTFADWNVNIGGSPGPAGAPGAAGSPGANGTNGAGYGGTSTTSLTIGTGSKAFTTQTGLAYQAGGRVRASSGTDWMEGVVASYTGGVLTLTVDKTNGAGTVATWVFNVAGEPGPAGAGTGDTLGAAAAVAGEIAVFADTTGKQLGRINALTGLLKVAAGVAAAAVAGTDYLAPGGALGTPSGGTLTNCTGLPLAGVTTPGAAAVKLAGKEAVWLPARACVANTTNGPSSGTVETTTNKNMLATLDFDATTQESAQFAIRMPKSWNEGTITAAFTWSHPSTSTNFGVAWDIAAVALGDGDAGDAAFGTAQQVADTGGTTNTLYVTGATSALTVAGSPAAEDWVLFRVRRVPADGSDTMAVDARLHGVTLYLTTDAANDA